MEKQKSKRCQFAVRYVMNKERHFELIKRPFGLPCRLLEIQRVCMSLRGRRRPLRLWKVSSAVSKY